MDGAPWPVTPNAAHCDPDHAIHGDAWLGAWKVTQKVKEDSVATYFECNAHGVKGQYPYCYSAAQALSLNKDTLTHTLSVTNKHSQPAPLGAALHPYFNRTPDTTLHFDVEQFWIPPENSHKGLAEPVPSFLDYSTPQPLPGDTIDHSFIGFGGRVLIAQGGRVIELLSDAPHIHFYAPKGENFFCLEPITHLPGKFATTSTEPGDTVSIEMKIRLLQA